MLPVFYVAILIVPNDLIVPDDKIALCLFFILRNFQIYSIKAAKPQYLLPLTSYLLLPKNPVKDFI